MELQSQIRFLFQWCGYNWLLPTFSREKKKPIKKVILHFLYITFLGMNSKKVMVSDITREFDPLLSNQTRGIYIYIYIFLLLIWKNSWMLQMKSFTFERTLKQDSYILVRTYDKINPIEKQNFKIKAEQILVRKL
jgi:hypothetical protein